MFLQMSGGIYIDDAGTPGAVSPSAFLHTDRKSWAAVIVPEKAAPELATGLEIFLKGIRIDYAAAELHFTDIYGGRGTFKDVPIEKRYELIDLMAGIFEKFQLPILFQTCSPEFLSEIRPKFQFGPKIHFLNLDKHDHFALLFLLYQVRRFVHEHKQHFRRSLPVIIDEGLVKAGTVLELPDWADAFREGRVEFRKSHECPFLQLADFAAFAIGRSQWLLGKGELKPRDIRFMEIVSAERLCVINLPSVVVSPDRHTVADYDEYLKRDRREKGLPDDPPEFG
ncbi:MAG: DUF3800 domain-containing protein [Candidatus Hodarchaeota archaeon]